MSRDLPEHPNLEHLRKQAKRLLDDHRQGVPDAVDRLRSLAGIPAAVEPRLIDAQHAIAREYGFASWPRLKQHVAAHNQPFDPVDALVAAVKAGDADRTAQLLERHRELRTRLDDPLPGFAFGETALLAALPSGSRRLIDILLEAGANIRQKSHWWAGGFGVLDHEHGLASFLIERGAEVDVHAAARLGMLDTLVELVAAAPERVHARGGDGQTPLHVAATVDIASYLLEHGAAIDARDIDHESTPARYMVRDRPAVARFLVSRGCHTDILMAAALGDLPLLRAQLDADPGCIATSVTRSWFPMQNPDAGGTIYIWTLGLNQTPHSIAREFGHEAALGLLMERSPAELKLTVACELGDTAAIAALLAGASHRGSTLSDPARRRLVQQAESNNAAAVRLMLGAGWPADVRGAAGETALHFAAWHGNFEMVREILRHHPPLEVREHTYHGTPLGWALHGSEHCWHPEQGDHAATVQALLAAGATAPALTEDLEVSASVRSVLRLHAERNAPDASP